MILQILSYFVDVAKRHLFSIVSAPTLRSPFSRTSLYFSSATGDGMCNMCMHTFPFLSARTPLVCDAGAVFVDAVDVMMLWVSIVSYVEQPICRQIS